MNKILSIVALLLSTVSLSAQDGEVLDKVIGVVGDRIILYSELQERFYQAEQQGIKDENIKCIVLEEMMFNELLLNKAEEDSVYVGVDQVEYELDRRMRFFIQQFGSQEKMEKFYEKSVLELKSELRGMVEDQLLVQQMTGTITSDLKVTPAEVKSFYASIPKDSLPYIDSEVELAQIVKKPPISQEEKNKAILKLEGFKQRITDGDNFSTIAVLYSEDPGSAAEGGELGFMTRGMLVPEFSRVMFSIEPGVISDVVETEYGFHIIQLLEKRGQEANARHILVKPKMKPSDLLNAKTMLDSVYAALSSSDTMEFEEFATTLSDDENTKSNGGIMINPITGNSRFQMEELSQVDPGIFIMIDKLKVGEISKPEATTLQDGSKAYRIVKLISVTEPHVANLQQDYYRLQVLAKAQKESVHLEKWVNKYADKYYIKLNDGYGSCQFAHQWKVAEN